MLLSRFDQLFVVPLLGETELSLREGMSGCEYVWCIRNLLFLNL